jgi:sulfur relay (sulfurtransferase) DsrC/TusE family protein
VTSTISREEELIARKMLTHPEELGLALKERHWKNVVLLLTFISEFDISHDLAMTDPALYRTLRDAITTFYLRGGGALNLEKIRQLALTNS